MGAGNPLLRTFDEDRIQVQTYFFDFLSFYIEDLYSDDVISNIVDEDFRLFLDNLCDENEEWNSVFTENEETVSFEDLSSAYRSSAIVLAETSNSYLISEDSCELDHVPLAIIPRFSYDDIYDQVAADTGFDVASEKCEAAVEKEYNSRLSEFFNDVKIFWGFIKWKYNDYSWIRQRTCTWTSSTLTEKEITELSK